MANLKKHILPWMTVVLTVFMAVNMGLSALALARYDARTSGLAPANRLDVFLDEHFDNARMEREMCIRDRLERMHRRRWWDYSDKKFNLDGYVCLQYSVLWGLLGMASVLWGNVLLLRLCALLPGWLLHIGVWAAMTLAVLDQLGAALAVFSMKRGKNFIRSALFATFLVPPVVASVIFKLMFGTESGLINTCLLYTSIQKLFLTFGLTIVISIILGYALMKLNTKVIQPWLDKAPWFDTKR